MNYSPQIYGNYFDFSPHLALKTGIGTVLELSLDDLYSLVMMQRLRLIFQFTCQNRQVSIFVPF